ncbi:thioesterase II family protein [Nisaea denitrificans]|uniref:thioesterase II family protein n=1 Tax=Nisaea denitrificans TaxID=390877 RepID=UPI00146FA9CB|nr:alpha/beta fold hydrolase [Nisaea denitrificans]
MASGLMATGAMPGVLRSVAAPRPWLPVQRRAGAGTGPGSVLICFPPAGAGAGFFREWAGSLPGIRIVPVQLPGREERFGEAPEEDAVALARNIADAIASEGWDRPVLLGYSYGALLAFETAMQLEAEDIDIACLIAMARAAPQTTPQPTVADMDDDAFLDYVRRLGGLPQEVDEVPEFAELMLPVMRADFRANDLYARAESERLRCPIHTIAGTADAATADGRDAAWAERTKSDYGLARIDGGHFFINENPSAAFHQIRDMISSASHAGGSKA